MITPVKQKITAQEIFDRVWQHFIVQKRRYSVKSVANTSNVACVYRNARGNACAVGIFLSEKSATLLDDNYVFIGYLNNVDIDFPEKEYLREHVNLLSDLQIAHDAAVHTARSYKKYRQEYFRTLLEDKLRSIATKRNLNVKE